VPGRDTDRMVQDSASVPAQVPTPPPTPPGAVGRRWAEHGRLPAWAAAVLFSAIAGRFAPQSAPAEFAVLGAGLAVCAWALRRPPDRRRPAPDRIDGHGTLPWLGLLLVFLVWELFAFFRGSTPAHPTLSILLGPLLADPLSRGAGYLLWLAGGVWIARR